MNATETRRDVIVVCTPYAVVLGVMLMVLAISVTSTEARNLKHQLAATIKPQP